MPRQEEMFCDEFILADLRLFENCQKVLKGCDHCFNLAADMGGMGFIQSNHSVIFYNNVIYPEGAQLTTEARVRPMSHWFPYDRVRVVNFIP
jgi:GDP-D-mannose 3',5'-epimerase